MTLYKKMDTVIHGIQMMAIDMDGTLIDSMWVWPDIGGVYLEKYHLTKPENFHEGMEGMSYTEVAQYFLDIFPTLSMTIDEVMDEWTQMAV